MSTASGTALLSDVHGVLPVLEAVLAEPAVQAAELVVDAWAEQAARPDRVGSACRPGDRGPDTRVSRAPIAL